MLIGAIAFTAISFLAVVVMGWKFFTSYEHDTRNPVEKINEVAGLHRRDINWLAALVQMWRSMRSVRLANTLGHEAGATAALEGARVKSVEYLENIQYEQNMHRQNILIAHEGTMFEADLIEKNRRQAQLESHLIEKARELDMLPADFSAVQKQRLMDEQARLHESRLAADEIRASIIAEMLKDHAKMNELQGLVDQKLMEIAELGKGFLHGQPVDKSIAAQMITSRQNMIVAWERQLHGLQQRLLEDDNGQDFQRTNPPPEVWRDTGQELEAGAIEIQAPKRRGRPPGSLNKRGGES